MTRNINDNKTYGGKGEARKKLKDAEEMFAAIGPLLLIVLLYRWLSGKMIDSTPYLLVSSIHWKSL